MKYSKIISCGSYLPKKIVKNDDLPDSLDTSDEWIRSRTGIEQRHIAGEGETTADMAAAAAKQALDKAGLTDVDLIIVATTTPDNTFPATAASVQRKLGIKGCAAFDMQAVCSGFIFALATVDDYIKLGKAQNALVIGAETLTRVLDWNDRGTAVLFGDGAGAVVLQASEEAGILSSHLHTDGEYYDELYVDGGVSTTQTAGLLRMNGREVFKHAVEKMGGAVVEGLKANNLSIADMDWLIPHQANKRIMDTIAKKYEIPESKVICTVPKHANTSAASIPLAMAENWDKFNKGDVVALTALGAGFTWGSVILRF